MKNYLLVLLVFLTCSAFAQEMGFGIFGTQTNQRFGQYSVLTLDTLRGAKTLSCINGRYRSDWVASYIGVAVSSDCNGVVKKAESLNDTLTQAQVLILEEAELGCRIYVEVDYIPENTLKYNPPRKMNFSLTVVPIIEAKYPGGFQDMSAYLKRYTVDEISEITNQSIEFATVRFNIDGDGNVADAQVFDTSNIDKVDKLLLKAISNMPKWTPAEDACGQIITQEFEFSIWTRRGC